MGPLVVVVLAVFLEQDLSLPQASENLPIQQLVPQTTEERLDERILPGLARRNEGRLDPFVVPPSSQATDCSCCSRCSTRLRWRIAW